MKDPDMQNDKENFLDSTTLIAIALLLFSWWGWDYYMKKKYPPKTETKRVEVLVPDKISDFKKLNSLNQESLKSLDLYEEKTLEFKGENMEIVFSSKGFGGKAV